jgi:hypothetical protein
MPCKQREPGAVPGCSTKFPEVLRWHARLLIAVADVRIVPGEPIRCVLLMAGNSALIRATADRNRYAAPIRTHSRMDKTAVYETASRGSNPRGFAIFSGCSLVRPKRVPRAHETRSSNLRTLTNFADIKVRSPALTRVMLGFDSSVRSQYVPVPRVVIGGSAKPSMRVRFSPGTPNASVAQRTERRSSTSGRQGFESSQKRHLAVAQLERVAVS